MMTLEDRPAQSCTARLYSSVWLRTSAAQRSAFELPVILALFLIPAGMI
jgi:hypothetical protein